MTAWWRCPWCFDHLADKHPHIVAAHEHLLAISHYRFLEVHQ